MEEDATGEEHEAITMTAMVPFRNPSHLADLVHEKYPEINIEFIPYSGYNYCFCKRRTGSGRYAGYLPRQYVSGLKR